MQEVRTCKTCEQELSITDFKLTHRKVTPSHPAGKYYTRDCKNCLNSKRRANRAANKERERTYRVRDFCKKLGFTKEQAKFIQEGIAKHNGHCDICGEPPEDVLHIDHCHKTNVIRGLLCRNCNLMLGFARDSIDNLIMAAVYLKYENAYSAYPDTIKRPSMPAPKTMEQIQHTININEYL